MRIHGPLMVLLCAFIIGSCAQSRSARTKIYEDRRTGVTLRKDADRATALLTPAYVHPITFEVEDLKYLLGSISCRKKEFFGWSELARVFNADELYRLTPHLVEAFSRAATDEQVLFRLTTAKRGALFASERFTNGRLFVRGKKLNCLFANIDVRPDAADVYDGDPRNNYAGVLWKLETRDWQHLVQGERGTHYNWIELDWERGLEEKKELEQAARQRAERRAIESGKEFRRTGWEDWEPDDEADTHRPREEEDVYFPPFESP